MLLYNVTIERMHVDTLKMLAVVAGAGMYTDGNLETGLRLSKLTHIYHCVEEEGYEIIIASPEGDNVSVDLESLEPMVLDKLSKEYWDDPEFKNELRHTKSLDEVTGELFDCIYLAGRHGTAYDFSNNTTSQTITKEHYGHTKMVAVICHGISGLLDVRSSNGEYLIKDRRLTRLFWFEGNVAGRKKEVPFDLEAELKKRGADYEKALIPVTSRVVADCNLITGENPFSSKEIAEVIMQQLRQEK